MAINNWRYVVIWGYMDPNWNIVEEKELVPATNTANPNRVVSTSYPIAPYTINKRNWSNAFSPAETYWFKADGYYNQWDTAMWNAYRSIADAMWSYSGFANQTVDAADALINYIRQNEAWLQSTAWNLYNQLAGWIQQQRDYVEQMFGPQWELTQEVNKYYDDLGNYLATDAGRQAAKIAAQWMHSWASLWAIRAQENEAYNQSFQRYVQAKEQQINAKQQIASNLINFMSTLRQEYWDTTNKYVIELYKRANDMYNSIAQSVYNDINSYNQLKAKASASATASDKSGYYPMVMKDNNWKEYISWVYSDKDWNMTEIARMDYNPNNTSLNELLNSNTTDTTNGTWNFKQG